jgi:hypothetical protein
MGNCIDLNVDGNKIMQGGLFWRPHWTDFKCLDCWFLGLYYDYIGISITHAEFITIYEVRTHPTVLH